MATIRLIHITDLHLGAGLLPRAQGHDPRILERFFEFVHRHPADDRPKWLIVTGDITARGSESDLQMYLTYRDVGYAPDATGLRYDPLRAKFDTLIDLPGNHDYWNGILLNPKLNPRVQRQYFPDASTTTWETGRHLIAVHRLCSTRGASGKEQFAAVGAFRQDDLQHTADAIDAVNVDAQQANLAPFHLIATHHSPAYGSPNSQGLSWKALLDLARLVRRGPVSGILSGHVHTRTIVHAGAGGPACAEVRCASTMQIDTANWTARWNPPPPREFLVHEVDDDMPGPPTWSVTAWAWTGNTFVADPAGPQRVRY